MALSVAASKLFGSEFLSELEGLSLLARKTFRGQMRGERRSRNRGSSVEFQDYRQYVPGDDLRHLDWGVYGRLERLVLRIFVAEEDLHLYILLDSSKSMAFGNPPKFDFARKIAAALAHISLSNQEQVAIVAFAGSAMIRQPLTRGRGKILPLLEMMANVDAEGSTSLGRVVYSLLSHFRTPGIVVVISDFFDPYALEAVKPLVGSAHQPMFVQILTPNEKNPEYEGDLNLRDCETGKDVEVSISPAIIKDYKARFDNIQSELKRLARQGKGEHFEMLTNTSFSIFIREVLRRGKLLK